MCTAISFFTCIEGSATLFTQWIRCFQTRRVQGNHAWLSNRIRWAETVRWHRRRSPEAVLCRGAALSATTPKLHPTRRQTQPAKYLGNWLPFCCHPRQTSALTIRLNARRCQLLIQYCPTHILLLTIFALSNFCRSYFKAIFINFANRNF